MNALASMEVKSLYVIYVCELICFIHTYYLLYLRYKNIINTKIRVIVYTYEIIRNTVYMLT